MIILFLQQERYISKLEVTSIYGDIFVDSISEDISLLADGHPEKKIIHRLYWTRRMRIGEAYGVVGRIPAEIVIQNDNHETPPSIEALANIHSVRYYLVDSKSILWVSDTYQHFHYFECYWIGNSQKNDTPEVANIAQFLLQKNPMRWYHMFAKYMLDGNDSETLTLTKRYAENQFTPSERLDRIDSDMKDIAHYAKSLLQTMSKH